MFKRGDEVSGGRGIAEEFLSNPRDPPMTIEDEEERQINIKMQMGMEKTWQKRGRGPRS